MAHFKKTERGNLPFLCLFVLPGPSTDYMIPAHIVEENLFTQSTESNAESLSKKKTSKTHPEKNFFLPTT